ncbi:amidase domain-containing protein [Salipaludibacillus daqingensis]|uniref:amidase domain-containing protein n=1 Tax=Salipaludibacillus daqingensis TaxID=3041001 RepID=UPI002476A985|nr:amidase domain-containing protein [Salipaludibacillus daqingensis]
MNEAINLLKNYWEKCCSAYFDEEMEGHLDEWFIRESDFHATDRKIKTIKERKAEVLKNIVQGEIIKTQNLSSRMKVDYLLTIEQLMNQKGKIYLETQQQYRRAVIEDKTQLIDDYLVFPDGLENKLEKKVQEMARKYYKRDSFRQVRYEFDRLAAVRYAERWWDDYNPDYRQFENDCTNYISQCLKEAGAPMRGEPDRSSGWWFTGNQWSFSWAVAHSLRWFLSGSQKGLRAKEVSSPKELMKGDVICYDFNGDGNWQHTTIVVDKDADHMPLVNAHTTNSRMRYWSYEDSSAWTPSIQYKYFHIVDGTMNG